MHILANFRLIFTDPKLLALKIRKHYARAFSSGQKRYVSMQKSDYETSASNSSYEPGAIKDFVVGSYEGHNNWPDYDEFLMRYTQPGMVALDFGCGPGRNIVKYRSRFTRIDGADISARNLKNARANLQARSIPIPNLYETTGTDLGSAPADAYDFIFSTITMQHICVHEIRRLILAAMHRALKPGGRISIQMGFGADSPDTVGYFENFYDALRTNRSCDTRVESPDELKGDLESLGFISFEHWIRPVGPGDLHPNWIFFTAVKPTKPSV